SFGPNPKSKITLPPTCKLHVNTPVHDDNETCLSRSAGGFVVYYADLQPECFRADGYGLVNYARHVLRAAEDVYHFGRLRQVCQGGVCALAEHLGLVRVDRGYVVA